MPGEGIGLGIGARTGVGDLTLAEEGVGLA